LHKEAFELERLLTDQISDLYEYKTNKIMSMMVSLLISTEEMLSIKAGGHVPDKYPKVNSPLAFPQPGTLTESSGYSDTTRGITCYPMKRKYSAPKAFKPQHP